MEELKIKAQYDADTRRCHRYLLHGADGDIRGSIYIAKEMKVIPKVLVIEMVVGEKE